MLHKSGGHLRQKILCCSVFGAFEEFWDDLPKSTNPAARKNLLNFRSCIQWNLLQIQQLFEGSFVLLLLLFLFIFNLFNVDKLTYIFDFLYILVLGIRFIRKLTGKKSCNTTKQWQKHFELKSSIPYFEFNEVSLMSKNYLRVVLHLF